MWIEAQNYGQKTKKKKKKLQAKAIKKKNKKNPILQEIKTDKI